MASISFVQKLLRRLIDGNNLSINSNPDQIWEAINHGCAVQKFEGITVRYTRSSVFPQWVKRSEWDYEKDEQIWVNDHRWGEGSNERPRDLYRICTEMLLVDAGLAPSLGFDNVQQHGVAKMKALSAALAVTASQRADGSPYTQNYATEYAVAMRIGSEALIRIYSSMHWKGWAEAVEWMVNNPGYEILAPWHYLFRTQHNWDDEQKCYVEQEALIPSWGARDAVWAFQKWATHAEMARVVAILSKQEADTISFAEFFRLVTSHKSWKEQENYKQEVEYVRQLLETIPDIEAFEALSVWDDDQYGRRPAILSFLRDSLFGWGFTDIVRAQFLQAVKTFGFETAWDTITERTTYQSNSAQRAEMMLSAAQKLGADTVISFLREQLPAEEYARRNWLDQFINLVNWYQPQVDDDFATFAQFEQAAIIDSWGEETKGWLNQLAHIIGIEAAWTLFKATIDSTYGYNYEKKVQNSAAILKIIPVMISKLNSQAVKAIITATSDLKYAAQLIEWYQPQEGDNFSSFDQFVRRATKDGWGEQINGWHRQLVDYLQNEEIVWAYFLRSGDTGHDAFFFVPNLIKKLDAYSVKQIISQVDKESLRLFAQAVDAYQPENTRFDGWRAFKKHVDLQKNKVIIPGNDPQIAAAVAVMLEAPGLNIGALRKEIQTARFQALARGEMDKAALLQPVVKMYYLTPAHELIRIALGEPGKAERHGELRMKLSQIATRFHKAQMVEYSQLAPEERGNKPQQTDLLVSIPEKLEAEVISLLEDYGVDTNQFRSLEQAVGYAVGIMPKAEDHKGLYTKLKQLALNNGLTADELLREVPQQLVEDVWALLVQHKTPMGQAYKAEILAKSDPRGWVGGNWVVCCASFGTTKNWDYMYNKTISYQIVSLVDPATNTERIISWSVIVATKRANKVIDLQTVTLKDVDAWTIDNIEGNKNHSQHFKAVEQVTSLFWKSITNKRVMVGAWHNDLVPAGAWHETNAQEIRSTWVPMESMDYSDFFRAKECQTWVLQEENLEKVS